MKQTDRFAVTESLCTIRYYGTSLRARPNNPRLIIALLSYTGPGWLKNLYFAYLLVLKAVIKTEPYWQSYQFYTGNNTEDMETRSMVMEIIQAAKLV